MSGAPAPKEDLVSRANLSARSLCVSLFPGKQKPVQLCHAELMSSVVAGAGPGGWGGGGTGRRSGKARAKFSNPLAVNQIVGEVLRSPCVARKG